jgi:hypothetical protein
MHYLFDFCANQIKNESFMYIDEESIYIYFIHLRELNKMTCQKLKMTCVNAEID